MGSSRDISESTDSWKHCRVFKRFLNGNSEEGRSKGRRLCKESDVNLDGTRSLKLVTRAPNIDSWRACRLPRSELALIGENVKMMVSRRDNL